MSEEMILVPQSELDRLHEMEKENRKLKEQLRAERMFSDRYRKLAAREIAANATKILNQTT
jgi:hypothetical protein